MNMECLVRSALFNNDGVGYFNSGFYDDAIASFTLAMETLKADPLFDGVDRRDLNADGTQSTAASQLSTRPQQLCSCDVHAALSWSSPSTGPFAGDDSRMLLVDDAADERIFKETMFGTSGRKASASSKYEGSTSSFYIFRDPIDIPMQSIFSWKQVTEKLVTKVTMVIMYNLGLSFHLGSSIPHATAALDPQQNEYFFYWERLQKARALYELAFEVHIIEEGCCDVTILYTLALMNNLGLIYNQLGEWERSYQCFQNMLSMLMLLSSNGDDFRGSSMPCWDGFFSNAMAHVFLDSIVSAPAA